MKLSFSAVIAAVFLLITLAAANLDDGGKKSQP
jgi:hypothetical protein